MPDVGLLHRGQQVARHRTEEGTSLSRTGRRSVGVHAAHDRARSEEVGQVKLGTPRSPHVIRPGFSGRPGPASKDAGSPSYMHLHGISFLGWQQTSSQPRRAMNAHPRWGRRTQRALTAAARTSASRPMLPLGNAGNDGQVEILSSSTPSPHPQVGSDDFPPWICAGARRRRGVSLTGWLGLLRALYQVMGAPADGSPADPHHRAASRRSRPARLPRDP